MWIESAAKKRKKDQQDLGEHLKKEEEESAEKVIAELQGKEGEETRLQDEQSREEDTRNE